MLMIVLCEGILLHIFIAGYCVYYVWVCHYIPSKLINLKFHVSDFTT